MASTLHRSKSDPPPPITVEDTATGEPPVPSPSPTMNAPPRAFSAYERPTFSRTTSQSSVHDERARKGAFGPGPGHRRKHSPNIEWKGWNGDSWKQGRVLLIDYVAKAHSSKGRKKIVAQEFCDIDSLRRFYRKEDLSAQAALRVIHVQDASWATRYLLRKFNIDATDDLVGTTFGRWARYEKPQKRGGKPVLNGRTFRPQRDPWRGISRASFGCDYLKHYPKGSVNSAGATPMMELNHYDDADQPCYGFDVHVQRISVYVQLKEGSPGQVVDPDIPNPYNEEAYEEYQRLKKSYGNIDANVNKEKYTPKLKTLDNSNTIIIFENSQSGSVRDTLIGARQELESRWRRLTFYLPREDMDNDDTLVPLCMDFVLTDIFKALALNWNRFVATCETHVGILEDKIYENPADESRAPELWKNSAQWLKVERLLYIHADLTKDMRNILHDLAIGGPRDDSQWLGNVPDDLDKLCSQWDRDIMAPTSGLSDLMYKSVGIRDSRHSLQLGLSMWRLSWITFIFLPLTFTVGFFGMNVNTFENNPPIKWWFVVSFPVLAAVIILWYAVKHNLSTQRQHPLRRGVYEALYHELATDHSSLWTRKGPRPDVIPKGSLSALKWRLVTKWFSSDRLIPAQRDPATVEFGVWSRTKQWLVRRWLKNLPVVQQTNSPATSPPTSTTFSGSSGAGRKPTAVGALVATATSVAIAELDPTVASEMQQRNGRLSPSWSDGGGGTDRPGSSGANSGIMVEEKVLSEDDRSGDERSRSRERDRDQRRRQRLAVPYSGM